MKTLLYLNPTSAVWIGYKRSSIVAVQEQPLLANDHSFVPCDWLGSKKQTVQIIVDNPFEEIDICRLKSTRNVFQQHSNIKALRQRLIQQYPQAIVHTPMGESKLNALLVHQFKLLAWQQVWVNAAKDRQINFDSVLTGTEVLADCTYDSSEPVLLVSRVSGVLKHLLCSAGSCVFVRVFQQENPKQFVSDLSETIKHLHKLDLVSSVLTVCVNGLSEQEIQQVTVLGSVAQVKSLDAMVKPVRVSSAVSDNVARQHLVVLMLVSQLIKSKYLTRKQKNRYAAPARLLLAGADKSQRSYPHVVGLSLCALLSIAYTVVQERDRHRQHKQHIHNRTALSQVVQGYHADMSSISKLARPLAKALEHTAKLEAVQATNPAILLTIVATALADYSELQLQEFEWSVIDGSVQSSAGSLIEQPSTLINTRIKLPKTNVLPSKLVVSVSGVASVNRSLREQQTLVNDLADALQGLDEIDNVHIVETPLTHASRLNRINESAQPLSFRIQFDVVRAVNNDA